MLRRETAAAGLVSHQANEAQRPERLLVYARLSLELARRTGEADGLAKAAAAAERAARVAATPAAAAPARILQAACSLAGGVLFGAPGAAEAAQNWLATPEVATTTAVAGEAMALRARVEAGRALGSADLDRAVDAAGVFDIAIDRLDAQVRENGEGKAEAAALRTDRAEFLIAFGVRLKDRSLVVQAEADLRQLVARIDPDFLPLTWARAEAVRASALAVLGDLSGEPRSLAESVRVLASALSTVDATYSPLDRARLSHTLALSLQSLGEACDDEGFFDHAIAAYDQCLAGLAATPRLPLRATAIHDRAVCVARQAERTGDLAALARAEATFRSELMRRTAGDDPVAWAVTQLALARLYEVRAALVGDDGPPAETGFALSEALEVFAEQGLKTLAELATDALARLRGEAGD